MSGSLLAQTTSIEGIVAIVGKEPILLSDLNSQAEFYAFNNRVERTSPEIKQQVLEAMINEKLILNRALEDTTISISEDQVTNQLEALVAQRIQQLGSEKKVEELYGMPITKIRHEFRDETRKQLLIQTLQQVKFGDLQPSKREVEEFYNHFKDSLPNVPEEVEIYHIFRIPSIGVSARNSTKVQLGQILDSIEAGGDFAEFARRYSQDRGTALQGGDLGFVRRGEFFKDFEEVVFSLKEREISGIIETPLGFHIIQLLERRGDQVHPRHILMKFKNDSTAAESTRSFLNGLRDSIALGADFADLARRYSNDKTTGPLGGYLGKLPVTQIDPSLIETLSKLHAGEVSNPVEVRSEKSPGYQIVYLKTRLPEHPMRLPQDWKHVEQLATSYKRSSEYQKWMAQLRTEIYWEKRL